MIPHRVPWPCPRALWFATLLSLALWSALAALACLAFS